MSKPLALPTLISLVLAAPASAGFTGLSATTTFTSLPQAGTPIWVVQISANFDNVNDRILGITGATLTASQNFYHHSFGGNTEPTSALVGAFPDLAYDTFVTMNELNSNSAPGANTVLEPGSNFPSNSNVLTGGWFANPAEPAHLTGANSYLIAQLSLTNYEPTSTIDASLTVRWRADGAGSETQTVVSNFGVAVPGPGALALLGLAGLVGSRRRRST